MDNSNKTKTKTNINKHEDEEEYRSTDEGDNDNNILSALQGEETTCNAPAPPSAKQGTSNAPPAGASKDTYNAPLTGADGIFYALPSSANEDSLYVPLTGTGDTCDTQSPGVVEEIQRDWASTESQVYLNLGQEVDPAMLVEVMGGEGEVTTPPPLTTPQFDLMDTTPPPQETLEAKSPEKNTRKRMAEATPPEAEEEEEEDTISKRVKSKYRRRRVIMDESTEEEGNTMEEEESVRDRRSDTEKMEEEEGIGDKEKGKEEGVDPKKVGRPKKRTRKVVGTPDIELSGNFEELSKAEFKAVSAFSLSAMGLEWMKDIDEIRGKCGRMQGGLSGRMKERINKAMEVIRALAEKAETAGDPLSLKLRINKLKNQLEERDERERRREEEFKEMKEIIKIQREEIRELKAKVEDLIKGRNESMEKDKGPGKEKEGGKTGKGKGKQETSGSKSFLEERLDLIRQGDPKLDFPTSPKVVMEDGSLVSVGDPKTVQAINKQISDLFKLRAQARKQTPGEVKVEENAMQVVEEFPPLPQRPPRPAIRAISNIQIIPPRTVEGKDDTRQGKGTGENKKEAKKNPQVGREEEERKVEQGNTPGIKEGNRENWTEVVKRGRKNKGKKGKEGGVQTAQESGGGKMETTQVIPPPQAKSGQKSPPVRHPPKTAAVTITGKDKDAPYDEILRRARQNIQLDKLGIKQSKLRKAANGGYVIEIPGPENDKKADVLAEKLKEVLPDDIRVARPSIKGEMRIIGFDGSVTHGEIVFAIEDKGGCKTEEIRIGDINQMNNGLYTVWAQCPLAAALKISAQKKIKIGWTVARVELLKKRPIQCYRCWKFGHLKTACKATEDRSSSCYGCGETGHSIRNCSVPPRCIVCEKEGRDGNHRLGSFRCELTKETGRTSVTSVTRKEPVRRTEPMEVTHEGQTATM